MLEAENLNALSADKPLTKPEDDRLGYAPFARHLSDSIRKMVPAEGLVLAIYGPWGSGKTTLLNFVAHYLRQKPESDQPIIVEFNPWWFSGHEDLTRRFFDQLQAVLSKWESVTGDLKETIATFAELVAEVPIPAGKIGKILSRKLRQKPDVVKLKGKVTGELKKQDKRILVIIDDIDRLTAEEIRYLFRTIKAVADFPNVVYLLAFDKKVVIRALEEEQGIPGEAYLEKIVQVPFELPLPDKVSLRRLLFEKLATILDDTPSELFDPTYWANVYFQGIDHFIATPRDIDRLTNTLSVTYAAVEREVNPVDFIAVQALQVFCPLAYDIVRNNSEMFVGAIAITSPSARISSDERKRFHDSWLEQVAEEDRESVRQLLLRLFPRLEAVWGNRYYSESYLSSWRKQRRVCSAEVFPVYFRLAVPEGRISNVEMKAILDLTDDAEAFGARLVELANQERPDGMTRARAFLEQLEDYTREEIPSARIPSILQALFDVGDELLRQQDDRRGPFDFGNDRRITFIIGQLLPRLDESARFEALKGAISQGQAISTIVDKVTLLSPQREDEETSPDEDRLINSEHLAELQKIALEKIQGFAQENLLLQAKQLPRILYAWQDWSGEGEAKEWVQEVISDDSRLVTLLEKFLQRGFSQTLGDTVARTNYRLDPELLEPFLDPSEIIERVRNLAEGTGLTENQRIAVEQFIREYELRQQGKDPDAPWTWERA